MKTLTLKQRQTRAKRHAILFSVLHYTCFGAELLCLPAIAFFDSLTVCIASVILAAASLIFRSLSNHYLEKKAEIEKEMFISGGSGAGRTRNTVYPAASCPE